MADTVSDFLLRRLSQWNIRRIYGFPGDGINGLMGAMDRAEDRFQMVRVTHEEMAAFMACAHAKFTGEVGVCMATSGPGAIHLLNGLYDAKMDHQPVVAIVGQQARLALGGSYQQEVDLISLYKDVAHEYVHMVSHPGQVRHLIDRAIRTALAERTVTCVIVPNDVQEEDAIEVPPRAHGTLHSSSGFQSPRIVPIEGDLRRAADILNEGKKVAMLVGAGALRPTSLRLRHVENCQAFVAANLKNASGRDRCGNTTDKGIAGRQRLGDRMRRFRSPAARPVRFEIHPSFSGADVNHANEQQPDDQRSVCGCVHRSH